MEVAIRRQEDRDGIPYWQTFRTTTDRGTVLDALLYIQWELDGTLGFRRNCRNVICGSCAMQINGRPALACQMALQGVTTIEPMANFPVIKDLIVDMDNFWQDLQRVVPVLERGAQQKTESLQRPGQRSVLAAASGCILCGCCYAACNVKVVSPEFVGPHALAKGQRLLADNRDIKTQARLELYHHNDFVWGCTRCFQCNEVCPVGVQPLDRITEIKQTLLQNKGTKITTAVKHRRVLIDLVKRSGWLDEALFTLRVVNVWGVLPLGMRLVFLNKFPYPWQFRASGGAGAVRKIIEAVQAKMGTKS